MRADTELDRARQRVNRIQTRAVGLIVLGLVLFITTESYLMSRVHTVGNAMNQVWAMRTSMEEAVHDATIYRNTGTDYAQRRAIASAAAAGQQVDSLTALANTAGSPGGLRGICVRANFWQRGLAMEMNSGLAETRMRTEPADQKVYRTVAEQAIDGYVTRTSGMLTRESQLGRSIAVWCGSGMLLALLAGACGLMIWTRASISALADTYQRRVSDRQPAAVTWSWRDPLASSGEIEGDYHSVV